MKQQLKEFRYRAISEDGKIVYGTITDFSINDANKVLLSIGHTRIIFM